MFLRSFRKGIHLFMTAFTSQLICAEEKKNIKTQTYLWGNGVYQARPDALLQFHNFTPKKMRNLPNNLICIEFGEYYEAGIDANGGLHVWLAQEMDANLVQGDKDYLRRQVTQIAKNVREVKFTQGYIWVLTNKDQVLQYPIIKQFNEQKQVSKVTLGKPRTVDPLKGSKQISTGIDHLIALKQNGDIWAMGDDTYGQCANEVELRPTFPPFVEKRVTYPIKINHLRNIKKIAAAGNHCLALDESGTLFGWGSNSNMQLSHQQQFSQMNTPLICSFRPIKISKNLDNIEILDIKSGEQFSVLIAKNKTNDSYEVYTFGSNLRGQLGIGEIRHIRDVTKVDALSNFVLKKGGKQRKVQVTQLACGNRHCIALLNIGYIMQWGDNQYGQMANKKRSPVYSPIILRDFSQKNILGVFAGNNASGVIIREQA